MTDSLAVVLGRKNFLFAGNKDAGENLAALYTVVATCVANEVDPLAYLTDVLTRLDSTPRDRIDQILPQNWAAAKP
jgi:transposase